MESKNIRKVAILIALILGFVFNVNYVKAEEISIYEDIVIDTDYQEIKGNEVVAKASENQVRKDTEEAKVETKAESVTKAQDAVTSSKSEQVTQSEAPNAPSETKAETKAETNRELEDEEPAEPTITLHIMDNRTGSYQEYKTFEYAPGDSANFQKLNMYTIFGLGSASNAKTIKFTEGDYTYTFAGWFVDSANENQLTNTSGVPNETFGETFSRFAVTTNTSYPNGLLVNVLSNLTESKHVYIYANWNKTVTPVAKIHIYDTFTGEAVEQSTSPVIRTTNGSKSYYVYELLDRLNVSSGQVITTDDYIYTFAGWYDADGNKISEEGTVFGEVTLTHLSESNTRKNGLKIASVTPTVAADVHVYAHWDKKAAPKVIVKYHDTVGTLNGTETVDKGTLSSTIPIAQVPETTTVEGKKYNFVGWSLSENGEAITTTTINSDDEDPTNDFSLTYVESTRKITVSKASTYDAVETINIYALWEEEIIPDPHYIIVEFYDVKPGKTPVLVHSNGECKVETGLACTGISDTLDQIFDEKDTTRPYSGIHDEFDNTETDSNHIYTFLGFYDAPENGTLIDSNYTLSENYAILTGITATYGENGTPYEIEWSATGPIDEDTTIKVYAYWSSYETPVLQFARINKVTNEYNNPNAENINGTVIHYSKNLPAPTNPAHYEFMYWKVYKIVEDETTGEEIEIPYDDNEYINEQFNYTFDLSPENEAGLERLVARAIWQPSVTLNVYKEYKTSMPSTYIIHTEESTIAKGNKVVLDQEPVGYGYTKPGYDFVGYFMKVDGEEIEVPVGKEFTAPEASPEKVTPNLEYNVYAKWERTTETVTVSKVWEDESNNAAHRPDTVTLELFANYEGEEVAEDQEPAYTVELGTEDEETTVDGNTWSKELVIYPYDEQGNELIYTIKEQHVTSYESEPSYAEKVYTVTNTVMADGTVIVKYLDVDTGLEVAETEEITDSIEQPYETVEKTVAKYKFVGMAEDSAAATGAITAETQYVTYLYERTVGYIRVHHVDLGGTYISLDKKGERVQYREIIEGNIGEEYNAQPITIYGYRVVDTDGTDFNGGDNEELGIFEKQGVFTKEGFDIFFSYEEISGKVIVHYIDKFDNSEIEQDVLSDLVGEAYEISYKEITDYTYANEVEGEETGVYTEEDIDVYYYYNKNNGNLYVHHVDLDTNEEFEDSLEESSARIGTPYTTSALDLEEYEVARVEGNPTGEYAAEDTVVTYYYTKKNSSVTVKHIGIKDGEEKVLAERTFEGKIGTDEETSPLEFKHYRLIEPEEAVTVTYTLDPQTVIYYYEWIKGNVTVYYVAGEDILKTTELESGNVDEPYETTEETFEGYDLVGNSGNINGYYNEEDIEVFYYYEKQTGTVVVHHIDADTNTELGTNTLSGEYGETYETVVGDFEGSEYYDVVEPLPENAIGAYNNGEQEVTYYYVKHNGVVKVYYRDLFTNEQIDYEEMPKYVGDEYQTEEKYFEGYKFVRVDGTTEGTYPDNTEEVVVTYFYQQVGKVVAHYYEVDTTNPVADDFEDEGPLGTYYKTEAADVEGYSLVETPENAVDKYVEGLTEVIYYYQKLGKVITHFLDNQGNELTESETQTGVVGEGYTTTPVEVEGYELTGTPKNATGEYAKEDINVVYIYTEITEPTPVVNYGTVVVHYVDEDGNSLFDDITLMGEVGTEYKAPEIPIEGYTLTDCVRVNRNIKALPAGKPNVGVFEEGSFEINMIYSKDEEPVEPEPEQGTVIAYYVDENGNAIAEPMIVTNTIGSTYITYQKVIAGYTGTSVPENKVGKITEELLELTYTYAKNEEEEETSSCENNCNSCCCNTCNCEDQQPQIIININNENNNDNSSDNHSENNNDNNVENNTDVNNENNNQDETNVNIENNPINTQEQNVETGDTNVENNTNVETGDTNVNNEVNNDTNVETGDNNNTITTGDTTITTGDTTVTTGDTNIENNPVNNNDINNEANPTNTVENNTDVDASSTNTNETNSESNPVINLDNSSESNPTIDNSTTIENNPTNTNEANPINTNNNESNASNTNESNPTNNNDGSNTNTNTNENNNTSSCEECEETSEEPVEEPEQPTEPKAGKVIVKYVDEEGYSISPMQTIEGAVDEEYSTDKLRIAGYEFESVEGEVEGTIEEGTKTVKYVYRTATPAKGTILVHYRDEEGNTLASDELIEGNVGDPYTTIEKYVEGYELSEIKKEQPVVRMMLMAKRAVINQDYSHGEIAEGETEITYVYVAKEESSEETSGCCDTTVIVNCNTCPETEPTEEEPTTGKVVVTYIDLDGNEKAPSETIEGEVGEEYEAVPAEVEGYTVTKIIGDENGNFINGEKQVIYIYNKDAEPEVKKGIVIAHYVDTLGNKIAGNVTFRGTIGTAYETFAKLIENYTFVKVLGETKGTYTEADKEVTYVYSLTNSGDVAGETEEPTDGTGGTAEPAIEPPHTSVDIKVIPMVEMIILSALILKKREN